MFGFGNQQQQLPPWAMQQQQQQPQGLSGFLGNNSSMLMNLGMGLLDHRRNANANPLSQVAQNATIGAAFDTKRQERTEEKQKTALSKNASMEWLRKTGKYSDDELGQFAQMGMLPDVVGQEMKALYPEPPTTDDLKEFKVAKDQGFEGGFMDYMAKVKTSPVNNVTIEGNKYGTIPPGQMIQEDANGVRLVDIPGGPAAREAEALAAAAGARGGQGDVTTRVITSAAQRAREAAKQRVAGPYGQGVAGMVPQTSSAEVSRQVAVLKSQATIQNLNAMRKESPTGGALGNVTEKEGDMLAAKSGALDPSSPTFERDLDDYELTLLQVVHGPEAGTRIFEQTRAAGQSGGMNGTTSSGVRFTVEP